MRVVEPEATPSASPKPNRKIDLPTAELRRVSRPEAAEQLTIRNLKGPHAIYTPNLAAALLFKGLAYKPRGVFTETYQLLAGPPLDDPRLLKVAIPIGFIPAFDFGARKVILVPLKLNRHGKRILPRSAKGRKALPELEGLRGVVPEQASARRIFRRSACRGREAHLGDGAVADRGAGDRRPVGPRLPRHRGFGHRE